MRELEYHDLSWCLRRAPKKVLELMRRQGKNVVVAGGYIRARVANERPSDIDLFTPTPELAKALAKEFAGQAELVETNNAYTIPARGLTVQFIHRWSHPEPTDLLCSFDFTIACAAFWWEAELWNSTSGSPPTDKGSWKSLCDERFYSDLAGKRLRYLAPHRSEDAGGSLLRVLKFYDRGYRIPLDSLGAVCSRLMQGVDLSKGNVQDEKWLAKILTGLLREVDPNVDPTHLAHLPAEGGPLEAPDLIVRPEDEKVESFSGRKNLEP